jgi:hypothetical protein
MNYGLNPLILGKQAKQHFLKGLSYENDCLLKALKVVPECGQTSHAFDFL